MKFLLFAVILTRSDITFAKSKLFHFNIQPEKQHHAVVKKIFQYLWHTKDQCIQYGNVTATNKNNLISFVCVNDAFFVNNILNHKNSQNYMMKLFNKSVVWKMNKQNTITTSSIEIEFLAMSQTIKKIIYLFYFMKSLTLYLSKFLSIECDNAQMIKLLIMKSLKFQMKFRHIDIHAHWLKQKIQWKLIHLNWISIKKMMMNDLIKSLMFANYKNFVCMIKLKNKTKMLDFIKKIDFLKESF